MSEKNYSVMQISFPALLVVPTLAREQLLVVFLTVLSRDILYSTKIRGTHMKLASESSCCACVNLHAVYTRRYFEVLLFVFKYSKF